MVLGGVVEHIDRTQRCQYSEIPPSSPQQVQWPRPQKKLAGTKVPAKFEQGGFTSLGDVRVRIPSFRAQVPETLSRSFNPGNSARCSIAQDGISVFARLFTTGIGSASSAKTANAVRVLQIIRDMPPRRLSSPELAEPPFGYLAQQEIGETR